MYLVPSSQIDIPISGNVENKRLLQKRQLIHHLYYQETASIAQLGKLTNLSLPSAAQIVRELTQENILTELGVGDSQGGRRPVLFGLKPNCAYFIGIESERQLSRFCLYNIKNEAILSFSATKIPLTDTELYIENLLTGIQTLIHKAEIPQKAVKGIGISLPGLIDPNEGRSYSYLRTTDLPLGELLTQKTGIPVYIDNDTRILTRSEQNFGAAANMENALCLNLGEGIGLGMILSGQIYIGNKGFSGEFGHIPMVHKGKQCHCGNVGCLETVASGLALFNEYAEGLSASHIQRWRNTHPNISIVQMLIEACKLGDPHAIQLIQKAGHYIGLGISTLLHLYNPDCIILGGQLATTGDILLAAVQEQVNKHSIPKIKEYTQIVRSPLDLQETIKGTIPMIMDHLFKPI